MAEYRLRLTYSLAADGDVIFPEGKTWDDVSAWHVRWDQLHVKFHGDADYTVLRMDTWDGEADRKFPLDVCVHPRDEDGEIDYDTITAEK